MTRSAKPPPLRPYAASAADPPTRPVYRPTDPLLPFSYDPRQAGIDLMILVYAARRHAQWLAGLGPCPPDVLGAIHQDFDAIERALRAAAPVAPVTRPERGGGHAPLLWDATAPNHPRGT